jgi:shikimate kinase
VGIILAKVIGYDFIDSDLLIQRREGMRLPEVIQKKGVDGFRPRLLDYFYMLV